MRRTRTSSQFAAPRAALAAAAFAALLCALAATGCGRQSPAPAGAAQGADASPPPVPITAVNVRVTPLQRRVSAVGTLFPAEEVVLANQVVGRIVERTVDQGDWVEPGKVLVRIDPTDFRHKVAESEFALRETLAGLGVTGLEVPAELDVEALPTVRAAAASVRQAAADKLDASASIGAARADIASAKVVLANAEFKYQDCLRQRAAGAATPEELADKTAARDSAKALLDAGESRLAAATARAASADARHDLAVAQQAVAANDARAKLAEARRRSALLDAARSDLERCEIRAPTPRVQSAGGAEQETPRWLVSRRRFSVGDYAKEATELFRLVLDRPVRLRARVPERFDNRIAAGLPIEVHVDAWDGVFKGVIAYKNVVDVANRAFEIEALLPNDDPGRRLNPGTFAKVDILTGLTEDALMVPQESVVSFAGVVKIFLLTDGKSGPEVREVQVAQGESREFAGVRWVEIRPTAAIEGGSIRLTAADRVVTSGTGRLSQGRRVELKAPPAEAKSAK